MFIECEKSRGALSHSSVYTDFIDNAMHKYGVSKAPHIAFHPTVITSTHHERVEVQCGGHIFAKRSISYLPLYALLI